MDHKWDESERMELALIPAYVGDTGIYLQKQVLKNFI